jgi:hypothetical protein
MFLAGHTFESRGPAMPVTTDAAQKYIDEYVPELNGLVTQGAHEEAINFANQAFSEVNQRFPEDEREPVLKKVYEGRGLAESKMIMEGALSTRDSGDFLRSIGALSAAVDYMRTDLISGQLSDRGFIIAECFEVAEMALLKKKAWERIAESQVTLVTSDLKVVRYTSPRDSEIRNMQSKIVRHLINL